MARSSFGMKSLVLRTLHLEREHSAWTAALADTLANADRLRLTLREIETVKASTVERIKAMKRSLLEEEAILKVYTDAETVSKAHLATLERDETEQKTWKIATLNEMEALTQLMRRTEADDKAVKAVGAVGPQLKTEIESQPVYV